MFVLFNLFFNLFFNPGSRPFYTKKNFLKLLSIPIISKPLLEKKFTDSEPTKPFEPVIITIDIFLFTNS